MKFISFRRLKLDKVFYLFKKGGLRKAVK